MDNINLLRELLAIYGASTVSSLIFNRIYFKNRIQKAYDQSKRKLKYRDLSMECTEDLGLVKNFCKTEKALSTFCSMIPIFQVFYTARNITLDSEEFNKFFDERIEEINNKEYFKRRQYLDEIKKENKIPDDIKNKLSEEEYLPDEDDYLKVLVYRRFDETNK